MRITHPFHPLAGQTLRRVGERRNMAGRRVLVLDDADTPWAVPVEWTDVTTQDPENEMSAGRAVFLVENLVALAALMGPMRLS